KLRGPEGTVVQMTVRQPKDAEPRTYDVTRGVVPFEQAIGFSRDKDEWVFRIDPSHPVGYVQIRSVTASIVDDLRRAEERVRAERGVRAGGVRALVLDLG